MKQYLILILIIVTGSPNAMAALGDKENIIDSDKIKLRASGHVIKQSGNYSVHELSGPINTVKEYVSTDRTVFAVSWRGVKRPDLSVLFGAYYGDYNSMDAARPRMLSRQPVSINTSKIIVHKDGHMRDVRGFAYIRDQLPNGVSVEDLQ